MCTVPPLLMNSALLKQTLLFKYNNASFNDIFAWLGAKAEGG